MGALTDNTIASTYKQLLKITSEGVGADASAKYVEDGLGTDTALSLSTTRIGIGTASPDNLLHIKTTGSTPSIELEQDAGTSYKALFKLAGNDLEIRGSSGAMEFYNGGNNDGDSATLAMTIDSSQNATFAGDVTVDGDRYMLTESGTNKGFFGKDDWATSGGSANDVNVGSYSGTVKLTAGAGTSSTSNIICNTDKTTTFGSTILVPEYIKHDGDTNTSLRFLNDNAVIYAGGNNALDIGTSEIRFNHDAQDIDFVVETTGNGYGFHIDAGNNVVNIQRPIRDNTANSPDEVLTLKAFYPSAGTDGNAGAGPLLSFYIPDDETNPALGGGVACVRESADDSNMSSSLTFYTSGDDTSITEKVRINSSGFLGVGVDPSTALHIKGSDPHLRIEDSSPAKHWNISVGHAADGRLEIDDTEQDNGVYMNQGATSWTSSSDERLKTNWTSFDNALGSINSLTKVGTFQYTKSIENQTPKNDVVHSGLSAQEVQKFLPSSVSEDSNGILGLQYQHLIPVLIKAVQELSAKVEALSKELQDTKDYVDHKQDYNSMAGRINSCEARIASLEKE